MHSFAATAREYTHSKASQVAPAYSLFWRPMQSIPTALLSLELFKIVTG